MKAVLRGIRITPKKANLVAGMIRGKTVKEALALLKFMPKKAAKIVYKVLHSAAANAKNNFSQSIDDLVVTQVWAVKGQTLKRGTPANRGRMWPIHEVFSHITVEVGLPEDLKAKKPALKKSKKVNKAKTDSVKKIESDEGSVNNASKAEKPAKKSSKTVKKKEAK